MALRAVRTRSLADQIFEQLATEIVQRRYEPGASIPAERALAEIFKVNRHVVREALKRLEQIGLVTISHGGGTKVADFERRAGLDLLALMAEHARAGQETVVYWQSVLEMRAAIGADVVRLCAERASAETKREIAGIAAEMRTTEDPLQLYELELRLWNRMLHGAGNLAYRLAFNSLKKGVEAVPEMAVRWLSYEVVKDDYHASMVRALVEGDADTAESIARQALRNAVRAAVDLLSRMPSPPDASRSLLRDSSAEPDPEDSDDRKALESD